MGSPGLPMVYRPDPPPLDTLYSEELAARLCREYTEECVETLVDHMRDRSNPTTSLAATNMILDRGYGKPKEIKSLNSADGANKRYKVQIEFLDVIDAPLQKDPAPEPEFKD